MNFKDTGIGSILVCRVWRKNSAAQYTPSIDCYAIFNRQPTF